MDEINNNNELKLSGLDLIEYIYVRRGLMGILET